MAKKERVVETVEVDAAEMKRQRKAAKKAAAAAVEPEEVDEDEAKRQRKAAKKAAKAAQEEAHAAVDEVVEDELEAKKNRKEAKRAAKEAVQAAEEADPEVDEAEAKRLRKAAKRAAKEAAAAAEEAVVEEPLKKKSKKAVEAEEKEAPQKAVEAEAGDEEAAPKQHDNELTAFVRGLPFAVTQEVLEKDFAACGELEKCSMPLNEEGKPRGIAFLKFKTQAGFDAAIKFDNTEYGGRTIFVAQAGEKGKGKGDGKGKGKDGKGERDNENTVCIRGLPFSVEEEILKKDFTECGEIEKLNMPKNDEGNSRGIAFVKFKTDEGLDAALKFDNTEYGGRTIYVSKAGEGAKGKGKDKDGKGKGKDGKGKKGKDGKGKKGKSKGNPAQSGSIVESTGEKKTFDDDSDDA